MYAIVESGGMQFRMEPAATVSVPRLEGEPGETVSIETVLMCQDGDVVTIGKPYVEGALVTATIVEQARDEKIRGVKFKRRKKYRRHWGHRQDITVLHVDELTIPSEG
jgi:large subunit ribosomal protein L21